MTVIKAGRLLWLTAFKLIYVLFNCAGQTCGATYNKRCYFVVWHEWRYNASCSKFFLLTHIFGHMHYREWQVITSARIIVERLCVQSRHDMFCIPWGVSLHRSNCRLCICTRAGAWDNISEAWNLLALIVCKSHVLATVGMFQKFLHWCSIFFVNQLAPCNT